MADRPRFRTISFAPSVDNELTRSEAAGEISRAELVRTVLAFWLGLYRERRVQWDPVACRWVIPDLDQAGPDGEAVM